MAICLLIDDKELCQRCQLNPKIICLQKCLWLYQNIARQSDIYIQYTFLYIHVHCMCVFLQLTLFRQGHTALDFKK
jgi:hypothetical protein